MIRAHEKRTGERLTYAELAKRTKLSRATIEALGSRASLNTTLTTIDKLCLALDCELTDLVHFKPGKTGVSAEPDNAEEARR